MKNILNILFGKKQVKQEAVKPSFKTVYPAQTLEINQWYKHVCTSSYKK